VSGCEQGPTGALMTAAQASQLLDHVVYERIRELIDTCCLLDFEQELWRALLDCGLPRERIPVVASDMIARAFVRLGDEHKQRGADPIMVDLLPRSSD
jgi:hypothetical protein